MALHSYKRRRPHSGAATNGPLWKKLSPCYDNQNKSNREQNICSFFLLSYQSEMGHESHLAWGRKFVNPPPILAKMKVGYMRPQSSGTEHKDAHKPHKPQNRVYSLLNYPIRKSSKICHIAQKKVVCLLAERQ